MILLPRGVPLKEKIDPARLNLPDALEKLSANGFSGYLRFANLPGAALVVYVEGKMTNALFEDPAKQLTSTEALRRLFARCLAGGASLTIDRLSPELAGSIHALLGGGALFRGQDIRLIDVRALLERLRKERLSGALHVYTEDRAALIFYREGQPLGFFHDASSEIETTADASSSVARLPGAKIDVLTMEDATGEDFEDLAAVDLSALWQQAKKARDRERHSAEARNRHSREGRKVEMRQEALALLQGIAKRHIGRVGIALVDKEFARIGNVDDLAADARIPFFEELAKGSRMLAGPSKVKTMIDEMKQGLQGLLR